jgi:SAM-dependent methyltransferase
VAEYAREVLTGVEITTACDIGCATGRLLYELVHLFPGLTDVVGVEPSPVFTDYARKFLLRQGNTRSDWVPVPGSPTRPAYVKLTQGFYDSVAVVGEAAQALDIYTGMGEDTPRPDNYFDVLFCLNVVDRHPSPQALVERLGHLLREGGFFFLASPMEWDKRFTPQELWVEDLSLLFAAGRWEKKDVRDIAYPFRQTARYKTEYVSQVLCMKRKARGGEGC